MKFKKGDRVRMTEDVKHRLNDNGSEEHVEEFGDCVGLVEDPIYDDTDEFINVRWLPSRLRYGYSHKDLERA